MGTFGPFTDVVTVRVDGAYELYTGYNEDGDEIEILTLGTTSSQDPSRRALLSDTVAWAHATRGPVDATIVTADLNSEQPYVVTAVEPGQRGVERMLERMLAMGPSAGPLPVATGAHTGQIPAVGNHTGQSPAVNGYHTDPRGIPPVVSTPPTGSPVAPASPMTSYVTKEQRSRPSWLLPVVAALVVLLVAAGGFFVYYGIIAGDESARSEPSENNDDVPADEKQDPAPEWDQTTQLLVVGSATFSSDEGQEIAEPGWPFAFKVTEAFECESSGALTAQCTDGSESRLSISLNECPGDCNEAVRSDMEAAWQDAEPFDRFTRVQQDADDDGYTVSMSRFFEPKYNGDSLPRFMQLELSATGPGDSGDDLDRTVNDVTSQTAA